MEYMNILIINYFMQILFKLEVLISFNLMIFFFNLNILNLIFDVIVFFQNILYQK